MIGVRPFFVPHLMIILGHLSVGEEIYFYFHMPNYKNMCGYNVKTTVVAIDRSIRRRRRDNDGG